MMSFSLKSIYLNNATEYKFINGNDDGELVNLSKINIFLGSNNSGKSQLMRKIIKEEKLNFTPYNFDLSSLSELHDDLYKSINEIFQTHSVNDYGNIRERFENIKKSEFVVESVDFINDYKKIISDLIKINGQQSITSKTHFLGGVNYVNCNKKLNEIGSLFQQRLDELTNEKKINMILKGYTFLLYEDYVP